MDRVFLDANVLFSAAYRENAGLSRLWRLRGVRLVTSRYAALEARMNLPDESQRERLDRLLQRVEVVLEVRGQPLPRGVELPDKDRPILGAARAAGATHLLTGDVTHVGRCYGKSVAGVLILAPASYVEPTS